MDAFPLGIIGVNRTGRTLTDYRPNTMNLEIGTAMSRYQNFHPRSIRDNYSRELLETQQSPKIAKLFLGPHRFRAGECRVAHGNMARQRTETSR
ncbi:hypothetical protein HN011_000539 [Eciton burchellii]|nr:hypothetical protein HN011_000539 [Eciton burchellii]